MIRFYSIIAIMLAFVPASFSGCLGFFGPVPARQHVVLDEAGARKMLSVNSILIAPLLIDERVRRALPQSEGIAYLQQVLEAEATAQLAVSLILSGDGVFPPGNLDEVLLSIPTLVEYGTLNSADGVLVTRVHTIRQRVGSSLAATSPARVDFTMTLIETRGGSPLWQSRFHFEDQALSDNLLRLNDPFLAQKGARWLRLEEIWQHGVEKSLRNLAVTRAQAFSLAD